MVIASGATVSMPRGAAHLQPTPRDRLIVALDMPSVAAAEKVVASLGEAVTSYKIGLELVYGGGLGFAARLIAAGKMVFLDLKLHDIPNTVARAAAKIGELGAALLTVHAYPQTMLAARRALAGSTTRILAVTVMTSYDDADLAEAGYAFSVRDLVTRRAYQAQKIGIDGLVLAATEVATMRQMLGPNMLLVTPGIRPQGSSGGDQKRISEPGDAIANGADYLVVGRPITEAEDPHGAAESVVALIAAALPHNPSNGMP
jgi:orotidine-5'-phosphate decarboxylase